MGVQFLDTESAIGFKTRRAGYLFETEAYNHFQLILIRAGQLWADVGQGPNRLGPNQALILPRDSRFRLWCPVPGPGYQGIGINMPLMEDTPPMAMAFAPHARLRLLVDVLELELLAADTSNERIIDDIAHAAARSAIAMARQTQQPEDADAQRYWADRVRRAIDYHLGDGRPIREALSHLGIGYRQLCRHFESVYQQSPKRYQLRRRVEEAQRMLEQTRLPITHIALETGFSSSQHFASRFRAVTGESAREYRARRSAKTKPEPVK